MSTTDTAAQSTTPAAALAARLQQDKTTVLDALMDLATRVSDRGQDEDLAPQWCHAEPGPHRAAAVPDLLTLAWTAQATEALNTIAGKAITDLAGPSGAAYPVGWDTIAEIVGVSVDDVQLARLAYLAAGSPLADRARGTGGVLAYSEQFPDVHEPPTTIEWVEGRRGESGVGGWIQVDMAAGVLGIADGPGGHIDVAPAAQEGMFTIQYETWCDHPTERFTVQEVPEECEECGHPGGRQVHGPHTVAAADPIRAVLTFLDNGLAEPDCAVIWSLEQCDAEVKALRDALVTYLMVYSVAVPAGPSPQEWTPQTAARIAARCLRPGCRRYVQDGGTALIDGPGAGQWICHVCTPTYEALIGPHADHEAAPTDGVS